MKTSSAKAKGKRACQEVKALLHLHAPHLEDADIMLPVGSVPGIDIHLSPLARSIYNLDIEAKCQESLNIWAALRQAEENSKTGLPIVFFKRNRTKMYVALDAEAFLKLLRKSGQ